MLIHRTAVVHPDAEIAPGVEIGAYSIIGKKVRVGAETIISSHVTIGENTEIGARCRISSHAVIGSEPQDLRYKGQETFCSVGEGTQLREFVTINRGSKEGSTTRVGKDCMLMTGVHIAHDCQIGDRVVMANLATLGGHCHVGDGAIFGGQSVAHQFVRVGKIAMIGGTSGLMQDVPPFMMAFGHAPAKIVNINHVGIKRAGFTNDDRAELRECYRLLYRNGFNLSDALEKIESDYTHWWALELVNFFRESTRGTCRPVGRVTWIESQVKEHDQSEGGTDFFDELTTSLPAT